ncbi:MAG: aromatic ring-hydroxylating dioxygenase subunit alpha [Sphingomonadales bacterium]|nr:aromatic ring-hydroxylating dioxygenase subunit alpha [Sphingomonadales bacterium]
MNYADPKLTKPGEARCPAITTQEIIAGDAHPAPDWVRGESYTFLGDEDISSDRYTEASYAKLEVERLWPRTWQFACREEHIPEAGDYYVYDIGPYSLLVTRQEDGSIRAFHNACLHRGTKLRHNGTSGNASEFRCTFHAWSWEIDGSCKTVLCDWDFPHAPQDEQALPEAKVATLGGFVFVNMDPDSPSLEDYMGPEALAQFRAWKLEERFTFLHVMKRLPCNWKLNQEAFHEAYHVLATHPQVSPSNGDCNSQYDTYGANMNRFISTLGVVSPHLYGKITEQDVFEQFTIGDPTSLEGKARQLGEGESARAAMAKMYRDSFAAANDADLSGVSDSELLDCFSYQLFPNMFIFPGISLPMVYRFRPDQHDHRKSWYEVLFLRPLPAHGEAPPPPDCQVLEDHQSFKEAEGMPPSFGEILDQDTDNLFLQQEGLEASMKGAITLANYQEVRIRHFEQGVDRYVAMPPFKRDFRRTQGGCGKK